LQRELFAGQLPFAWVPFRRYSPSWLRVLGSWWMGWLSLLEIEL
jgi:hypothetical protein